MQDSEDGLPRKKWTLKKAARMIILRLRFSQKPAASLLESSTDEDVPSLRAQLKKAHHRLTQFQLKLHDLQDKNFKLQQLIEKYEGEKKTLDKESLDLEKRREEIERRTVRRNSSYTTDYLSPEPRSPSSPSFLPPSVAIAQIEVECSKRIKKLEEINIALTNELEDAKKKLAVNDEDREKSIRAMISDSHRELQKQLKEEKKKNVELHKHLQVAIVDAMKKGMESPGNQRSIDAAKLRQSEMRLEAVLDNMSKEGSQYERVILQLRQRIADLEEELVNCRKDLSLCASKTHLMDELLDLRNFKKLSETMDPKNKQVEVYKKQLEVQRNALVLARDELQVLSADYSKDRQLNNLRKENERLKEENESLRETLFEYNYEREMKVKIKCRRCEAFERQSQVLQQHIQNLMANSKPKSATEVSAEVLFWKDQVTGLNDRLKELVISRTEHASKLKELETEKYKLQISLAEAKSDAADLRSQNKNNLILLEKYETLGQELQVSHGGSPIAEQSQASPRGRSASPEKRDEKYQYMQSILQAKLLKRPLQNKDISPSSSPRKRLKQDLLGRLRGELEELEEMKPFTAAVSPAEIAMRNTKQHRSPKSVTPRATPRRKVFDYSTRQWKSRLDSDSGCESPRSLWSESHGGWLRSPSPEQSARTSMIPEDVVLQSPTPQLVESPNIGVRSAHGAPRGYLAVKTGKQKKGSSLASSFSHLSKPPIPSRSSTHSETGKIIKITSRTSSESPAVRLGSSLSARSAQSSRVL